MNWDNTKPSELLKFPNKVLRAQAIVHHVLQAGYAGIVCFTCGNAADGLRHVLQGSLPVVEVGPRGGLKTDKWWTPAEIRKTWPALFDATSGHLPLPLMVDIGNRFKDYLDRFELVKPGVQYLVPSGSGETIICLRLAYPGVPFCAVYDNSNPATVRDKDAPLNSAVDALFTSQFWNGSLDV